VLIISAKGKFSRVKSAFLGFDAPITFSGAIFRIIHFPHDDVLVLALKMKPVMEGMSRWVKRVLVDMRSSVDILYKSIFDQMGLSVKDLSLARTPLISFMGHTLYYLGMIPLEVQFGRGPCSVTLKLTFLVVEASSAYNAILGRGV
jgi:hypothetical protein